MMIEYKLETCLDTLCQEYPQYKDLQATWILNKRICSDALKGIILRYPHFSMHDTSHAEAVISKIEMILGERIASLSPTDIWLLLHAAYTHDLGMVILWDEITKLWSQPEFQVHLDRLTSSADHELREAAEFIKKKDDIADIPSWPLKAHRHVDLVVAAYFRGQHAQMSQKYIKMPEMTLRLDLSHSGLIQPRLIKLLGEICELHTEPGENILALDYQTNGFRSDYSHPRFIAMLLRLGDLLDIDNGRFNEAGELATGGLPESSAIHKEKHEATTHLLITPEKIEFRSDCPNQQAYLITRDFIRQLEIELDFFTKYWSDIVPTGFDGYAPRLRKKELLLNGTPDIEGVADLKLIISQEKAFQIIEGSNIYKDKFVFIREVIQNASDASKLQLWQDLSAGTYQAWLGGKAPTELQPYDVRAEIYQNYPIDIKLSTLENNVTQIEISDRGTGISVEAFKRMCKVGTSNSGAEKIQRDIQAMPDWMRPTAGFGVGLQSIFLLADSFEIDTNTGKEMFHAVVQSNRTGGYLQLQHAELSRPRGTTIRIHFRMPDRFQYSMMGETQSYLGMYLDPICPQNHLGEVRVMESIRINCGSTLFPLSVSCTEKHLESLKLLDQFPLCRTEIEKWLSWDNRYFIDISDDCSKFRAWDTQTASYGEFQFVQREFSGFQVFFKGNEVTKEIPYFRTGGISAQLDVYGLDTKETITLDRSSLTQTGFQNVSRIWEEMFQACIDCFLAQLIKNPDMQIAASNERHNFSIYTMWLLCNSNQRKQLPSKLLDKMSDVSVILSRNEDIFEKMECPVHSLIPFHDDTFFANVRQFDTHVGRSSIEYDKMCTILNQAEKRATTLAIADLTLLESTRSMYLKTLLKPDINSVLWLYSVSEQDSLINTDETTKLVILRGLGEYISGMDYSYQNMSDKAKRYAIPALKEYPHLAVNHVPYGIAKPHGNYRCTYIISPFIREEAEQRSGMSVETFRKSILSSTTFQSLVDFVKKNSVCSEKVTSEQIVNQYEELIQDYYNAF